MEVIKKEEKIIGVVEKILFKNETNGYHVLNINISDLEDVKINITQPNLSEKVTYKFTGNWTTHPKFGKQFKANIAEEIQPTTKIGLKAYLQSSFFPGIGPVISEKIVNHFGENIIEILNLDPEKLLEINGISKKKLKAIKESWEKNKEINDIMVFLKQFNISTLYATKIYEFYGKNCIVQIMNNPYDLAKNIEGIGFKRADGIALQSGFEIDDIERLKSCIHFILEQSNSSDGHCYLTNDQILIKSTELLNLDVKNKIHEALEFLEKSNEIKILKISEEKRYYSRKIYFNELYCAQKIKALNENNYSIKIDDDLLEDIKDTIKLSDEQKSAVRGIVGSSVSILTGGPGCGKTETIKTIVNILNLLDYNFVIACPTGRASSRVTESTGGFEASTIHRLLSYDRINGGFLHNENNPINAKFIIIDESSMIDINLASSLLRAISNDTKIVFIGDKNQLPSVGPGNFFGDLILSNKIPVFKLNKIFRQGKNSLIVKYAHSINNGEIPSINTPMVNPEIWTDGTDCCFIDSGFAETNKDKSAYPKWSSLHYGLNIIEMLIKLYTDIIPKYIGKDKEIQILIPIKMGDLGVYKINSLIQNAVNPKTKQTKEISLKDICFRENDKVIHIKNNYDLDVFNGEIGKIITINNINNTCQVQYNNKVVTYKKIDMLELELSYAITIHKSQGSQFDCILLLVMQNYGKLLKRDVYYTGLTRCKSFAAIIGQRHALKMAIDNKESSKRQTSLIDLLKKDVSILH